MRVDTAVRDWLRQRPGMFWAPTCDEIFEELSEKGWGGRYQPHEIRDALKRCGYMPRQQRYNGEEGWALALPE